MDIIKITFGDEFGKFETEFQEALDTMFGMVNPALRRRKHAWRPHVDIYESVDEVLIVVELAGVARNDIRVEVSRKILRLCGFRRANPSGEHARYRLAEIPYGYFERTFSMPWPIDRERVEARFVEGLLQIRLARMPVEKARTVSIQTE